jgi:hypothetical protein
MDTAQKLVWVINVDKDDLVSGRVRVTNGIQHDPRASAKYSTKELAADGVVGIYRHEVDEGFQIAFEKPRPIFRSSVSRNADWVKSGVPWVLSSYRNFRARMSLMGELQRQEGRSVRSGGTMGIRNLPPGVCSGYVYKVVTSARSRVRRYSKRLRRQGWRKVIHVQHKLAEAPEVVARIRGLTSNGTKTYVKA